MSDPGPQDRPELGRLDPDASASAAPEARPQPQSPPRDPSLPRPPAPVIDTRRYRWAIAIIGLAVVIGFSVYSFATHGTGTTGVPVGQRLHWFAAPLADSTLQGDPNLRPPCTEAQHDPRALNLCLDAHHSPVVVSFFVPQSGSCVNQVDALQTLSRRYPQVRFAAVAIHASHTQTATLVREHHWTIPVAYDEDGSVGDEYGVVICPMAELAARGGIVRDRLIGDHWQTVGQLGSRVAALARGAR